MAPAQRRRGAQHALRTEMAALHDGPTTAEAALKACEEMVAQQLRVAIAAGQQLTVFES